MAELLAKKPLFSGTSEVDQLEKVIIIIICYYYFFLFPLAFLTDV